VTRHRSLAALNRAVVSCRACPRLVEYREEIGRVKKRAFHDCDYWARPVPGFGDPEARLLIVGLAPAAHGANRTGRMFTGDSRNNWLYEALHRFGFANQAESVARDDGLALTGCYITAAARCAPPQNRPTRQELEACRPFLQDDLRLHRRVRVTLALGHVAHRQWLEAVGWWERVAPQERPKFTHGAVHTLPDGMILMCSYHPSLQNTNTGRLTRRMWHAVFRKARALVDRPA
jgi:uracil-DNA glycosylase family 4